MSSYVRWYKKEQEAFEVELTTLSFEEREEQKDYIRKKAIRLGMLGYCKEHGYLFDDEAAPTEAEVKPVSLLKRIFNSFRKKEANGAN